MESEAEVVAGEAASPSRLEATFSRLSEQPSGAMITYFPVGVGIDAVELADAYYSSGVDVLEVGLPTADPYLDGPVVASAMARALEDGYSVSRCLSEVGRIRAAFPDKAIEIFTYAEVVRSLGVDPFLDQCVGNGVDSVLIGGAPPSWLVSEAADFPRGIDLLGLAPFDLPEHLATQLAHAPLSGYVFLQATAGVTGKRKDVEPSLPDRIAHLRRLLPGLPVCTGFGIANAEHCRLMRTAGADGVIVGSLALEWVSTMPLQQVAGRLQALKAALSGPRGE